MYDKDLLNDLLDGVDNIDELIDALRKIQTQKKDEELRTKRKEEIAEARSNAIEGLIVYMSYLLPEDEVDIDEMAKYYTENFIKMEKQMDEMLELEKKFKGVFEKTSPKKPEGDCCGKRGPVVSTDDEVLKNWLKKLF